MIVPWACSTVERNCNPTAMITAAEDDRDEHVRDPGQAREPGDPRERIAAGPAEHRQRDPVIGQDRVTEPDAGRGGEQRWAGARSRGQTCVASGERPDPGADARYATPPRVKQRSNVLVVEGIDHLPAVALADDKPEVSQHAQLLRHRRLGDLQVASELTDRARAGTRDG